MKRLIAAIAGAVLIASAALAQPEADRERVLADDPPFQVQRLRLTEIPAPTGPGVALFNGQDLDEWETYLGYPDPGVTYRSPAPQRPIGEGGRGTMFRVVHEDGAPAVYVNGETWGAIIHRGEFADYHLSLEFKWGERRYPPRLTEPHNNGLLYHSGGRPNSVWGTWMPAVEFEIMLGSVGMALPVGDHVGVTTTVGLDRSIIWPHRRFMIAGRETPIMQPAWNVEAHRDAELPVGTWNRLDLYVLGDRAIHVVNGVPVMEVWGLSMTDSATGRRRPLTRGRIQLQSEGAETYFRNIVLEPISALPRIVRD